MAHLLRICASGAIGAMGLGAPGLAAEVTIGQGGFWDGRFWHEMVLTGPLDGTEVAQIEAIRAEASARMQAFMAANGIETAGVDLSIRLDSPGGSMAAGLALLAYFQENHIVTLVGDGAECLSACAIAFMGGTYLPDAGFAGSTELVPITRRIVAPGGTLGFHAPALPLPDGQSYEARAVAGAYDLARDTFSAFLAVEARVLPRSLLEVMIATPPDQMYVLTAVDDFARWGIHVDWFDPAWQPNAPDIARICVQHVSWREGRSAVTPGVAGFETAQEIEAVVASAALTVSEIAVPDTPDRVFAYLPNPLGPETTCVIELLRDSRGWHPWGITVLGSAASTDLADIFANLIPDGPATHLLYLPYDTDVSTLQ